MSVIMLALTEFNLHALNQANQSLHTVYVDGTAPASLVEIKTLALHVRTAIVTSIAFPQEMPEQLEKLSRMLLI